MDSDLELFSKDELSKYLASMESQVDFEVDTIHEQQLLSLEESELTQQIISKVEVKPIEIYEDRKEQECESVEFQRKSLKKPFGHTGDYLVPCSGLRITISIPYIGFYELWHMKPNKYQMNRKPYGFIRVKASEDRIGEINLYIECSSDKEPDWVKKEVESKIEDLKFYINAQEQQIQQWNSELSQKISRRLSERKSQIEKRNNVAAVLGIPLKKKEGVPDFKPIKITKKVIKPLPEVKDSEPEYGIPNDDYEHILNVIRHENMAYETTPGTFRTLGEEDIRNIILAHLNVYFEGEAKGEAFRKNGKTDILIEHENRAAFVAECKLWGGEQVVLKTIDQLLGYVTWRDSKTSIILFNKNVAGFSGIQDKIDDIFTKHDNYISKSSGVNAGEWRYVFKSKDDEDRHLTIHVFMFNLYVS